MIGRTSACAVLLGAIASSGCLTNEAAREKQAQVEATTPECEGEEACEVMWEAAQYWVRERGARQLDRYDPNQISTTQASIQPSQILMSTRRVETGKGYRFDFIGRCLSMLPCTPSVLDEHIRFNRFVRDSYRE